MWKTAANPGGPRDSHPQGVVDKFSVFHRVPVKICPQAVVNRFFSTVHSPCGEISGRTKASPMTGEPRNCCAPQKPPLCKGRWPEGPEGLCAGSYILRGLQVPANDPSVSLTAASVPIPSVALRHLPLTRGVGPYCKGAMKLRSSISNRPRSGHLNFSFFIFHFLTPP